MLKLSTNFRYGFRILIYLAKCPADKFVSVTQIASDENIPKRYVEIIIADILSEGWIISHRGAKGGYQFCADPTQITLLDIVMLLEKSSVFISCIKKPDLCERSDSCASRFIWLNMANLFEETAKKIRLSDVIKLKSPSDVEKFFPPIE